ncbi:MAG: hypothetical protein WAK23_06845 [Terriglobales bacterium]
MRIIIECPENILHLEAGYIYADCLFAQLQPSCSPAADHTFATTTGRWWHNTGMFSRCYALFVAALLLSFPAGGSLSAQSSADWDWMSNHFDKALHNLFPIDERFGGSVAYRSHRDLYTDVGEYSFVAI